MRDVQFRRGDGSLIINAQFEAGLLASGGRRGECGAGWERVRDDAVTMVARREDGGEGESAVVGGRHGSSTE